MEVRLLHIPCADFTSPRYMYQAARKNAMLNMEGNDVFDALPHKKFLNSPTWGTKAIDNVLVSDRLNGAVTARIESYRYGKTSDHRTVIWELTA